MTVQTSQFQVLQVHHTEHQRSVNCTADAEGEGDLVESGAAHNIP